MKVLLAYRDTIRAHLLREGLAAYSGCVVERAWTIDEIMAMQQLCSYPVIIVSSGFGMSALSRIRRRFPSVGLIVLADVAPGLAVELLRYADDVVSFQIDQRELTERVLALARRRAGYAGPHLTFCGFTIRQRERVLIYDGQRVDCKPHSLDVLETLFLSPYQLISPDELLARSRELSVDVVSKHIDLIVFWLREAMVGAAGYHHIATTFGRGYYLTTRKLPMKHKKIEGNHGFKKIRHD